MKKKLLGLILAMVMIITYTVPSYAFSNNRDTVGSKSKVVKAGKSLKLKAKVSATAKANKKLIWTSNNEKYATVKNGKVKTFKSAKGKKVKITVMTTDGSNKKATYTIKIK